jgi:hypothetical protein
MRTLTYSANLAKSVPESMFQLKDFVEKTTGRFQEAACVL